MKKTPKELLLRNYIDEDMQMIMKPLNLMQSLIFLKKYRIKDNFATSLSRMEKFYSCIVLLLQLITHVHSNITYVISVLKVVYSKIMVFYTFVELLFFGSGLIANVFINNYYSEMSVQLLLKMQEAHRVTKVVKDDSRNLAFWNWVYVAIIVGYAFAFTFYYMIAYNLIASTFLIVLCVNTNVIYGVRVAHFLTAKMNVLTQMVKGREMRNREKCIRIRKAYFDIMEAFDLFQNIFNVMITHHAIDSFCHVLIYVQVLISLSSDKALRALVGASLKLILIWTLKNLMLQILIGVECEMFYVSVEEFETTCIQLTNCDDCSDSERRTCSVLLRRGWSRASGCGLFKLDAMMPLRLIETLATYTTVLLQFAFL